jgi:hypothetical protein
MIGQIARAAIPDVFERAVNKVATKLCRRSWIRTASIARNVGVFEGPRSSNIGEP